MKFQKAFKDGVVLGNETSGWHAKYGRWGVYASRVRTCVYAHMRKLRIFRPLDHHSL
ncbi:hypothetical protein [Prevotella sp. P3-120]|uniref:hypothetical protein n=1 Tax=Prevotella sp. P3-120 TaxID=2024220 RepID=UPI001303BF6E|nr:hypothetical protein [Prevotella sp. P3-120]MCF2558808.1 hypothetical protein [Xylanibacter brevis]